METSRLLERPIAGAAKVCRRSTDHRSSTVRPSVADRRP